MRVGIDFIPKIKGIFFKNHRQYLENFPQRISWWQLENFPQSPVSGAYLSRGFLGDFFLEKQVVPLGSF